MHGKARRRCTAGPGHSFQFSSSLFGVDAGMRVIGNGMSMADFKSANSIFGVDAGVIIGFLYMFVYVFICFYMFFICL